MKKLDFAGLNQTLLSDARSLLSSWLPGGKTIGQEYSCGDLFGGQGGSTKVNVQSGKWSDFASGQAGGDLISLYAEIEHISQGDAFKKLSESYTTNYDNSSTRTAQTPDQPEDIKFIPPPKGTTIPFKRSDMTAVYTYKSLQGEILYFITRTDRGGKKTFCPWAWSTHNKWYKKAWPSPRPLYNLDQLNARPNAPILITEGEKACDAASKFADKYICMTWQGGSNAHNKSDFSTLKGRNVLIWPDADEPGRACSAAIALKLRNVAKEVKIINTDSYNSGMDAADFDFKDMGDFIKWAKPKAKLISGGLPAPIKPEIMPPEHDMPTPPPMPTEPPPAQTTINIQTEELPEKRNSSHEILWSNLKVKLSASFQPFVNTSNVINVLENHKPLAGKIWYDEFHFKYFTTWRSPMGEPREWTDIDDIELSTYFQDKLHLSKMTEQIVHRGVLAYARRNPRNEPKDWMQTLEWDNTPRLSNFFHIYFGTPLNDYTAKISLNFWISMIARVYKPGCKADNMVILEGAQGRFKSTALSVIGGKWYVETNENPNSKDFFQMFQGKIVIEIGELDSFNKAETTKIKAVVSTATDRFRPPYGRAPQDFPRQCIFVGTTNESNYLRDSTGARRFWPISIGRIDIDALRESRDQLFAEAISLFKSGSSWHEVPDSAAAEQEARREGDVWEEFIAKFIYLKSEVTIGDIITNKECLAIEPGRINTQVSRRVGKILRLLNWVEITSTRVGGKKVKVYGPFVSDQTIENQAPSPQKSLKNHAPVT